MVNEEKQVKITPMDIHNQDFKKRGLNGYDRREVDSFLDQVVEDYGNALDQMVDLKNEVVNLQQQVKDARQQAEQAKAEADTAKQNEQAAKQTIVGAQKRAQEIINEATEQAKVDANYQRQQEATIRADYERLKKEVSGYRIHIQDLLQIAIDNLNDEKWQKALDKYFDTERFYPPDGSEPITLADDDDEEDLDNDDEDEVDFDEEDIDEADDLDDLDEPQPLAGDSLNHETISQSEITPTNNGSEPTIVFPDDYKDHK